MTPDEIIESLYTQDDVQPDYSYMTEIPQDADSATRVAKGNCPVGVGQGVAGQVVRTPLIAPKCNDNLHKALREGRFSHLPNMFLAMAQDASEKELPSSTLVIGLHDEDTTGILPGQYVPQLWLVIHRMPDEKEIKENVPVPGQR